MALALFSVWSPNEGRGMHFNKNVERCDELFSLKALNETDWAIRLTVKV
jgi:hypothetical protein